MLVKQLYKVEVVPSGVETPQITSKGFPVIQQLVLKYIGIMVEIMKNVKKHGKEVIQMPA